MEEKLDGELKNRTRQDHSHRINNSLPQWVVPDGQRRHIPRPNKPPLSSRFSRLYGAYETVRAKRASASRNDYNRVQP